MNQKAKLCKNLAKTLKERLRHCDICPRNCLIDRSKKEKGYCGASKDIVVYSAFLHHGEEPGISGRKGSGTIFFSGCNLKCVYCQNYKFSHNISGKKTSAAGLAKIILNLQGKKAHNINLVTPTHFLPQIIDALAVAFSCGLNIPIVYNTSGYEKEEIIKQLAGLIDIYLTDLKYIDTSLAKQYSGAPEYPAFAIKSLLEMDRQAKPYASGEMALPTPKGVASPTPKGMAPPTGEELLKRGVVIRHLVLPNHIRESKDLLSWIAKNTPEALVSVMFQYQPYFKANLHPQINRPIKYSEYQEIKKFAEEIKIKGWIQEYAPQEDMAGL